MVREKMPLKPKPTKTVALILCDTKEQNPLIREIADEEVSLRAKNPDGSFVIGPDGNACFYDVEVVTKAGQSVKFEVKWNHLDALGSWTDRQADGHSRMTRQVGYVDALIVVWNDAEVERDVEAGLVNPSSAKGLRNRLGRMCLEADPPVLWFSDPFDTIAFFVYLRDRKDPIDLGRKQRPPPV